MNAQILSLDSEEHRRSQELLPWFLNGSLAAPEKARLQEHLARCSVCQGDAAALQQLRDLPVDAATGDDVDRGWAALRHRLEPRANASGPGASSRPWWRDPWRVAIAVQTVLTVGLAVALWWDRPAAEPYRALGAVAVSEANAIAFFGAAATHAQISAALRAANARVVGGPTATDAYLLRLPDGDPAALERLRAQPGVLDVQSLHAKAAR